MRVVSSVVVLIATGVLAASAAAAPIPDSGTPSIPTSTGSAAAKNPINNPTVPEQNPFMADNPNSNIHNDTWMTDAYNRKGPLGENLQTDSYAYPSSLCGSITFDSQGRILTSCPSIPFPPQIRLIDPDTLAPIDTLDMPTAPNPPNTPAYQNFTGGGYFFVDQNDKIWAATKTDHIYRIGEGNDGNTLTIERDYDLTGVLDPDTERITSALPDYDGRIWFVSKANAKIGTLDRKTGDIEDDPARRRRGDRELLLGRLQTASTSSPTSGCTSSRPTRTTSRRSSGSRSTRTRGSSSRARSTPAPERPRRTSTAATSRSPTTPTR